MNFGTILSPEALCPLAEPLPPDSAGTEGIEIAGLTMDPTAYLLEGEGGPRKGKAIKKRNNSEMYQAVLTCHNSQQKRQPASNPRRLDCQLVCRPVLDIRRRPTSRRTCKQDITAINQGSSGHSEPKYKTKEVRCTLESVYAKGTSSGSEGLL